ALRALLGHVEAIDQSGNNHHAPADSDQTGENSNQETEYQRDSYGHLQSLVKLEKKFAISRLLVSRFQTLQRVSKKTLIINSHSVILSEGERPSRRTATIYPAGSAYLKFCKKSDSLC